MPLNGDIAQYCRWSSIPVLQYDIGLLYYAYDGGHRVVLLDYVFMSGNCSCV